jgi:hypothetical protein
MILIVGSAQIKTAHYHRTLKLPESLLFTGTETGATVYHTSLADCPELADHLHKFTQVYWAESLQLEFNSYQEYFDTLYVIKDYVKNLDPFNIKPKRLFENTQPESSVFLGCSHTVGVGLDDPNDNYVLQVCKHFNTSAHNLAKGGLGNFRSFNTFNQYEFCEEQIVILQLTDIGRLQIFLDDNQNAMLEQQLHNLKARAYFQVFNDKQLLYMLLDRLDLVIKYTRSAKLRFAFFNLGGNPDGDNSYENSFLRKTTEYYLKDYKEYVPDVLAKNVDRGNDGLHFGPLSHRIWANLIIKKIEDLYQ